MTLWVNIVQFEFFEKIFMQHFGMYIEGGIRSCVKMGGSSGIYGLQINA